MLKVVPTQKCHKRLKRMTALTKTIVLTKGFTDFKGSFGKTLPEKSSREKRKANRVGGQGEEWKKDSFWPSSQSTFWSSCFALQRAKQLQKARLFYWRSPRSFDLVPRAPVPLTLSSWGQGSSSMGKGHQERTRTRPQQGFNQSLELNPVLAKRGGSRAQENLPWFWFVGGRIRKLHSFVSQGRNKTAGTASVISCVLFFF